jgi:hypothetical protein
VSVKAIPLIELRHFHDSVDDLWPKWYSKLFSRNEIMMLNEIFLPTKSQKNNQSCQMTKPPSSLPGYNIGFTFLNQIMGAYYGYALLVRLARRCYQSIIKVLGIKDGEYYCRVFFLS